MRAHMLAALVSVVALPVRLIAQTTVFDPHAVQPERPTVATHAGTVAPGWAEIEAGGEFDRYVDRSHGAVAPLVLKLGLAPRLQLNVQTPFLRPPRQTAGIGDFSAGVKWRFAEGVPILGNLALLPSVKVASGASDSGRGTGTTDISWLLISSRTLGSVAVDLNVGYTRRSGDGTLATRNASVWTASFGGSAYEALGWVTEFYGYPGTSGPTGIPSIVAVLAGPTFEVRTWLVLDAGVIVPITGPQPRALYAGVVYNIGRLWR